MGSLWLAWRNHDFKENFKLEAHLIQYPPSSRRMWDCIFKKWGTISGSIDEWAQEVGPWNWRLDQIWVLQAFRSELKCRHACSPGLWEEWSLGSMVMSNWWCRKICPRARGFGQWSTGCMPGPVLSAEGRDKLDRCRHGCLVISSVHYGVSTYEFEFHFCHLTAVWFWASGKFSKPHFLHLWTRDSNSTFLIWLWWILSKTMQTEHLV